MATRNRHKKVIAEMMPTRKWLTEQESCSYLNMSANKFRALTGLTISVIGAIKYYRVSQLDALLEKNIAVNHD